MLLFGLCGKCAQQRLLNGANMATAGPSEEDFRTSFHNRGRGVLGFEEKIEPNLWVLNMAIG